MKQLLRKLTETASPSGYESRIRDVIREEIAGLSNSVTVDNLGNLIVRMGDKTAQGKKVMIAAHMDEIGFIVSHVEKNGLVRFSNLGTLLPRYLDGCKVEFLNGVKGSIHTDCPEDLAKIQHLEKHFMDVGATSNKDCPVKIGDIAVVDGSLTEMGNRITAKALDNRSSCAAMISVMKAIKQTSHELVFVFSTQEEVGCRGAQTAAYVIDPEIGIALDVTPTMDILGVKMQTHLGKGTAIKVRDQGMVADPRIVRWMETSAIKNKIPYQMEVLDIGSTDARTMQINKAGMLAGALSIPCRYVHSPSEVIDLDDLSSTIKLLTVLLSEPIEFK